MNKNKTTLYNVYIVEIKTGKAVKLAGGKVRESKLDNFEMFMLSRINRDNFFIGSYEVGDKEDEKFNNDLK